MTWDDFLTDEIMGGVLTGLGCAILLGSTAYIIKHKQNDFYIGAGLTILALASLWVLLESTLEYSGIADAPNFAGANEYGITAGSVGVLTAFGGGWMVRDKVTQANKEPSSKEPSRSSNALEDNMGDLGTNEPQANDIKSVPIYSKALEDNMGDLGTNEPYEPIRTPKKQR